MIRAAGEIVGIEHAGQQLGVGYGRLDAAAVVAGRTGVGAGAARTDAQRSRIVEPRNRTAAGADFDNIHDRHFHRITGAGARPLDLVVGRYLGLIALDHRALCRGPADVEEDDVRLLAHFADNRRPVDARRRPGFQKRDRMLHRPLERRGAAVRLHGEKRTVESLIVQRLVELPQIRLHDRLDIGVEHGGIGALVFAPFPRHFVRGGDGDFRHVLAQIGGAGALVLGRRVAVQELDGDRLDVFGATARDDRIQIGHVDRRDDPAPRIDPFADIEAQMARHERHRLAETEIVKVGPVAAADLQHVAKAGGGDERRLDALAFGDGVDHRGAAMDEETDLGRFDGGHFQRAQHALGQIAGRRQRLFGPHLLGLVVVIEEVGEGAADVDR